MKRLLFIPLILLTLVSMAACGDPGKESYAPQQPQPPINPGGGNNGDNDDNPATPSPGGNSRYLVLYSSRSGNTERAARQIQTTLDCDILEIEPATPYDDDYNAMLSRAQAELAAIRQGNYPAISTTVRDFGQYDMVLVGYPIWHGSMATPMQSFLHAHAAKLAGKRIALFATSGGSGISTSVNEAKTLCREATVPDETLLLTSLSQLETHVATWLEQIGAIREEDHDNTSMKINMTIGDRTITATMEGNAAARDFLSRLPLDAMLDDYNNTTEKIFYPSPALTTTGVTRGCAPVPGDITIYAPWGNVAIFCKRSAQSRDLIRIGRIDDNGIEALTVPGNLQVKFEKR